MDKVTIDVSDVDFGDDVTIYASLKITVPPCERDHVDEVVSDDQPDAIDVIADLWVQHGPPEERGCDWFRTMAEPWRSLADALGVR